MLGMADGLMEKTYYIIISYMPVFVNHQNAPVFYKMWLFYAHLSETAAMTVISSETVVAASVIMVAAEATTTAPDFARGTSSMV